MKLDNCILTEIDNHIKQEKLKGFRRKTDYFVNGFCITEKHGQPVHPQGNASSLRHGFQVLQKLIRHGEKGFILGYPDPIFFIKALFLFNSIRKFGKSIGQFNAGHIKFNPFGEFRIPGQKFCQGGKGRRIII